MLKKTFISLLLAGFAVLPAGADVLQLKDKAAITGKIIGEKRGEVIVDVGYTWLIVPRADIVKISKSDEKEVATPVSAPPAEVRSGMYQSAATPPALRDVRELVKLLGEGV